MTEAPITLVKIEAAVEEIESLAKQKDNEGAHRKEDCLYADVLKAVADDAPNARALARAALQAEKIDYERWYV